MTEIEEENPRFVQFIKGFKVKRNELLRPKFYALQAYENNGGPIDHLIGKKQAIQLMKTRSITAKDFFYTCQAEINILKLEIVDSVPLIESPLSEEAARKLIIHPEMKEYNFKEPSDVTEAIENYPLPNLIFTHAY